MDSSVQSHLFNDARHFVVAFEIALQHHAPSALLLTARDIFVGSSRVADNEKRSSFVGCCRRQQQQWRRNEKESESFNNPYL